MAADLRALRGHVELEVAAIETAMFRGRDPSPPLQDALDELGLELQWNPPVIRADTAIFHNPSCLKFDGSFAPRISCATALVVTHENFLRPSGSEGFDVAHCLGLLDRAIACGRRRLAPVSPTNRRGVAGWLAQTGGAWSLAPFDWFNICDMPLSPPSDRPRDRRGRHSRPGPEKFPPLATMLRHFPPEADRSAILGADLLLLEPDALPKHWELIRFGELDVARFLEGIEFFVYFTHPLWRESFGRVIAEAIASGKVVITDPATAENFGTAVIASEGEDLEELIAGFVANPERYKRFVRQAQSWLQRFGPDAFAEHVLAGIQALEADADALL